MLSTEKKAGLMIYPVLSCKRVGVPPLRGLQDACVVVYW